MFNRHLNASAGFADGGSAERLETAAVDHRAEDQRLSRLSRLIEGEIVPRLLMFHAVKSRQMTLASAGARPSTAEVAELARLMLVPDRELADAYLESVRLRGASRVLICAELLAPTAKHLGDLWERDECDFAALTEGLQRLESVLKEFRAR